MALHLGAVPAASGLPASVAAARYRSLAARRASRSAITWVLANASTWARTPRVAGYGVEGTGSGGGVGQVCGDAAEDGEGLLGAPLDGPNRTCAWPSLQAPGLDQLGRVVVSRIQVVDGVTRTLTCMVIQR